MGQLTPNFADLAAQLQPGVVPLYSSAIPISWSSPSPPPIAQPQREKVAIIGTAPSSRSLAPFADLTWDIWGCSPGNASLTPGQPPTLPRVDAWFEIHANLHWPEYAEAYGKSYIKWLSEQKFPVYVQDERWHARYIPNGIRFPAQELVNKFGRYWFTSSFAWMMAFAIHRGYKEIGLFGVDMASKDEYVLQRQGFYRWLEHAESRGIKVTIPGESDLAQPPALYAYSDATPYGRKLHARGTELKGRSDAMNQDIQQTMAQLESKKANKIYIDGAREDNEYQQSIWMSLGDEWGEVRLEAAIEAVKAAGYEITKVESPSITPEQAEVKESTHA